MNELKNEIEELKKELEKYKCYFQNEIRIQKDAMRRKKLKGKAKLCKKELNKNQSLMKGKEHERKNRDKEEDEDKYYDINDFKYKEDKSNDDNGSDNSDNDNDGANDEKKIRRRLKKQ